MTLAYLDGVVTLSFEPALCNGCGLCATVCPHAVFRMEAKRAVMADRDACIECGACQTNCETGAIHVEAGVGCARALFASGDCPSC